MSLRSPYFVPAVHVLIWALVLAIPAYLFHNVFTNVNEIPGAFFIITNIIHIGLFYLNAHFLYPRLFNAKWWWLYIISLVALLYGLYYAKVMYMRLTIPGFEVTPVNNRFIFFPPVAFLAASLIYRVVANRIQFQRMEKERRAEQLAAELKFLRLQVSPHFLFNMMTNMVSLARQKSDLLEPSLIRLSELLRYFLYESNEEKFPVSKEVEYLKGYMELQQLRFGEDVDIKMETTVSDPSCLIEPLLLIPFVENAFKHGIGLTKDPFIHISLTVENDALFFRVSNNYSRQNSSKDKSSGIGLANVKNRLNLLYPGRYHLQLEDKNDIYTVELKLGLTC